jgi:trypsin
VPADLRAKDGGELRIGRLGIALAALLSAAAIAPATAPAQQARASITDGRPPSRAYPFMAVVKRSVPNSTAFGACGGTLIAARWVVTAGHCVTDEGTTTVVTPDRLRVLIGLTNIQAQLANANHPDWRPVSAVRLHPSYNLNGGAINYDVAVLQLAAPATQTQARLPRPADAALWAPGAPATVIGFGRTQAGGDLSPTLLEAGLTMRPDQQCNISNGVLDPATYVCATSGGRPGTCQGDSGGPLLVAGGENVLAGAVSIVDLVCQGRLNAFASVGEEPLNSFIRSIVPQSEIDVTPPAPQPGDSVTVRSGARNPAGAYTSLRWDLDADGAFDDAQGATGFTRTLATGQYRVGLEASNGGGDRETRYITVDVAPRTAINVAAPRAPARVVEGQPVRLTLAPSQAGSGTIAAQAAAGSARIPRDFDPSPLAAPVAFAAGDTGKTLLIPTRDDYTRERSESFRVALANPTGQLIVGADAAREITILDDDVVRLAGGSTVRVRRNRARVRVRSRVRGRVTVVLERRTSRGVTRLGSASVRLSRGRTRTVSVRLNRAGRRLLRRSRRTRAYVTLVRNRDPVGPPLRRTLRR